MPSRSSMPGRYPSWSRALATEQAIVLFISLSTWIFCWYRPILWSAQSHASATSLATEGRRMRSCATCMPNSVSSSSSTVSTISFME